MDPCRWRACEALVESLAAASTAVASSPTAATTTTTNNKQPWLPQRSEQQKALHIPAHLVYLYGLVVVAKWKKEGVVEYEEAQQHQFATLQKLYHQTVRVLTEERMEETEDDDADGIPSPPTLPTRLFQLSPSLQPSRAEDQEKIEQDVRDKMAELLQLADQRSLELLLEQETAVVKKTKQPRKRVAPKQNPTPIVEEPAAVLVPHQTLQQVLHQIQVPHSATADDNNPKDWISVGRGSTKKKEQPSKSQWKETPNQNKVMPSQQLPAAWKNRPSSNEGHDLLDKKANSSAPIIAAATADDAAAVNKTKAVVETTSTIDDKEVTLVEMEAKITDVSDNAVSVDALNNSQQKSKSIVNTSATENKSPTEPLLPGPLPQSQTHDDKNRVQELQRQLIEKDRQLEHQQQEHARELRKQRDQSEIRLQALQLRLYICETKLKTYEDALEDHVRAVANNTCGHTSMTAGGSIMSSPERPAAKTAATEDSPGKRPWVSSSGVVL